MRRPNPFFSVVIPAFNSASTISECIESVLAQEFTDWELVVVDDGSEDATRDLVRVYTEAKLIRQVNQGPGSARNHGARVALGSYVAFLDADDLWLPWTLKHYHSAIEQYQAAFLSGTAVEWAGDSKPEVECGQLSMKVYEDYLRAGSRGTWVGTCGVAVRRDLLLASGGFLDGKINAEDSYMWLRLGEASPFVQISNPASFVYRRSTASATGNTEKTARGVLQLWKLEKAGAFPGGIKRARERHEIVSQHARPACVAAAKRGHLKLAIRLYSQMFFTHVRFNRWRFLVAAPILIAGSVFKSRS